MDATIVNYVLGAFLALFIATTVFSNRQEEQAGIEKDVEFIKQKTISNKVIPNILDIFEHVPLAYGEGESELKEKLVDTLALAFERDLQVMARAIKCRDLARQSGRFTVWCGGVGAFLELIFILLVACLGSCNVLVTAAFGTSVLLLVLCACFWSIRRKNLEHVENLVEGV